MTQERIRLTATQLARFYSCSLAGYNQIHLREERQKPDPYRQKLMEWGVVLEHEVVEPFHPVEVCADPSDPRAGAAETLALMERGEAAIYQPVFFASDGRFEYLARPDLIVLADEAEQGAEPAREFFPAAGRQGLSDSCRHYRVVEIKNSSSATPEHILQLVFSAELLNRVQSGRVESHRLLLAGRHSESIALGDYRDWVLHILDETRETVTASGPPAFASKRMCGSCEWRGACFGRARRADLPGRVFGLTQRELACLEEAGIGTLSGLMENTIHLEGFTGERSALCRGRAKALSEGRDFVVLHVTLPKRPFLVHSVRDDFREHDRVAWMGGYREGPPFRFVGAPGEIRQRMAALLAGGVSLRDVVAATEADLEALREDVIFPLMGPGNPGIQVDLPWMSSLEGLAARAFALDLDVYDYSSLCRHFGVWEEDRPLPEEVWVGSGAGEVFDRAGDGFLETAWRLLDALAGLRELPHD